MIATLLFKNPGKEIVAVWLQTTAMNFPMALCWQIFFAGPLARLIFRTIFKKTTSAIIKSSVNHCFFDFSFNIRLNFCGETLYTCLKILDKCALDEKPVRIAISFKFKFVSASSEWTFTRRTLYKYCRNVAPVALWKSREKMIFADMHDFGYNVKVYVLFIVIVYVIYRRNYFGRSILTCDNFRHFLKGL